MPTSQSRQPRTLAAKISRLGFVADTARNDKTPALLGRALALLVEHHATCVQCGIFLGGKHLGVMCRELRALTELLVTLERRLPRSEPHRQLALLDAHTGSTTVEALPF